MLIDEVESWTSVASRRQRREKENSDQISDKKGWAGDQNSDKKGWAGKDQQPQGWTIKVRNRDQDGEEMAIGDLNLISFSIFQVFQYFSE